ncbi:MAG: ABC-2 transporter permease, partial [Ruminococcus sp.]|nr:ABC-2 transporter permease [Ruminococcus sp.]
MKGLIVKEFIMFRKNWLTTVFFLVVFVALPVAGRITAGLIFPLFLSIIMFSFHSYDEQCNWQQYSLALPYGRKNIVTAKYITFLIGVGISVVMMTIAYIIFWVTHSDVGLSEYFNLIIATCIFGMVYPMIMLPLSFRFNTNQSRIIMLLINGILGGSITIFLTSDVISGPEATFFNNITIIAPIVLVISIILY